MANSSRQVAKFSRRLTNTDGKGDRKDGLLEEGVKHGIEEEGHRGHQASKGVQVDRRHDLSVSDQTVQHAERNVDDTCAGENSSHELR